MSVERNKRGIQRIYSYLLQVHDQLSKSPGVTGRHPLPLGRNICCLKYQAHGHPRISADWCDSMTGSQYGRRMKRQKKRLPGEHPHCCTGNQSTDHLGILVIACWWNSNANKRTVQNGGHRLESLSKAFPQKPICVPSNHCGMSKEAYCNQGASCLLLCKLVLVIGFLQKRLDLRLERIMLRF